MKIRVAVTDDHPMVRDGLQRMLQIYEHIDVIALYASGNALLAGLKEQQPDVLLLDLQLPDMGGGVLVPVIRREYPHIRIMILTSNESTYNVKMLLNSGIHGYLLKNTEQALLAHAITQIHAGEIFVSPDVSGAFVKASLKKNPGDEDLSPREIDILRLIAEEYTSHEIAARLHLSYRTVENYRVGIMQKLGVKNMVGMVKKAILLGLVK